MKKIQKRTMLCILLCLAFVLGIVFFLIRYTLNLNNWTRENYYAAIGYTPTTNLDIIMSVNGGSDKIYYTDDTKKEYYYVRGEISDRNGTALAVVNENGISYNASANTRIATLHAVGDRLSNISSGALRSLSDNFSRYTTVDGQRVAADNGNNVLLSIDASVNQIALYALSGYTGTVGVYNYKTGEILCMVSTPSFDPDNVPEDIETNPDYNGAYINRFFSSSFTPGSIMKVVTLEAAIDNIPDLFEQKFKCNGSYQIGNQIVRCTGKHGTIDVYDAFEHSCNSAFAQIALQLEQKTMSDNVRDANLTEPYTIDGKIHTSKGSFDFIGDTDYEFAWSCIGLHHDLVNPCNMMVYAGAVANGGSAAVPTLLNSVLSPTGELIKGVQTSYTKNLINQDTANKMKDLMLNNTKSSHYQASRFNVSIGAKTGTVDRADGGENGWFIGFVDDERYPYAFISYVEDCGSGVDLPADIAAYVLNALCF